MIKPYYDHSGITIYLGDCKDILPDLPKCDLLLTDPPYSSHVHSNGMRGTRNDAGRIYGEKKDFGFDALVEDESILQFMQKISPLVGKWILIFSDIETAPEWRKSLECFGIQYIRTGAWVKIAPTPQFSGDRPAAGFEAVTIGHPKGKKKWNGGGRAAVWTHCSHGGNLDIRCHPAQKPLPLIHQLVSLFSDKDSLIIVPFMGSGTA